MRAVGRYLVLKKDPMKKNIIELLSDPNATKDVETGVILSKGEKVDPFMQVGDRVGYVNRTIIKNGKKYNANEKKEDDDTLVYVETEDILFTFL